MLLPAQRICQLHCQALIEKRCHPEELKAKLEKDIHFLKKVQKYRNVNIGSQLSK